MGKEQYKRITLAELIAKKEQGKAAKKKKETLDLYIASLDGVITIQEPSREICRDAVNMDEDGDGYLVYQCCIEPPLKSKELQEAYGIVAPPDIVPAVFTKPGEVSQIAEKCLELAGYDNKSVSPVKDLKN